MYFSSRTRLHFQQRIMTYPSCLDCDGLQILGLPMTGNFLGLKFPAKTPAQNSCATALRNLIRQGRGGIVRRAVSRRNYIPNVLMLYRLSSMSKPANNKADKKSQDQKEFKHQIVLSLVLITYALALSAKVRKP